MTMYAKDGNSRTNPFDNERIVFNNLEPDEVQSLHPLKKFGRHLSERFGVTLIPHSLPEEEENDECEFDIRITYVPDDVLAENTEADLLELRLAKLGKNAWHRTPHKRVLTTLILLLLIVLFVSIALFGFTPFNLFPLSSVAPQATQTTLSTRDDLPPTQRSETNLVSMGPHNAVIIAASAVPQYCPVGTMLGQGRQIGNFPVWMSGINTETATVHLPTVTLTLKTAQEWKGWVVHLHLSGRYKYLTTISLNALNIYGSTPPLLHNPYTALDSQRLLLDPKHPMGFLGANNAPGIGTWDISLFLPNAGCYAIGASWGPGHWLVNFAAGK